MVPEVPVRHTALGHGPAFRLTEASGRCRLGQATFAGTDGKGREAPTPAVRGTEIERQGSTLCRRSIFEPTHAPRQNRLLFNQLVGHNQRWRRSAVHLRHRV